MSDASGDGRGLSARDLSILEFELGWPARDGHKQQAIRDTFGFTPSRYYALLSRLIARDEALAHDPLLVRRLRRDRAQRAGRGRVGGGLNEQVRTVHSLPASK